MESEGGRKRGREGEGGREVGRGDGRGRGIPDYTKSLSV